MPSRVIENMLGGLSLAEPRNVEDNQFVRFKNMRYSSNFRAETREGLTNIWAAIGADPITSYYHKKLDDGTRLTLCVAGTGLYKLNESTSPKTWDLVVNYFSKYKKRFVLSTMDATPANGTWSAVGDAVGVSTSTTRKQGSDSVTFYAPNGALTNLYAGIRNTTLTPVDLSSLISTGKIRLWVYLFTITGITGVKLRWGSDTSNYYEATGARVDGGALTADWNFMEFTMSSATPTGTAVATAIDYAEVQITYDGTFPGHTSNGSGGYIEAPFRVDYIVAHPTVVPSGERYELTRWDFTTYKNAVGLVDGVDPYMVYSPSTTGGVGTVSIEGGPGGDQIEYIKDRIHVAGDIAYPHRDIYTGALPTNLDSDNMTNAIDVGADESTIINVLKELGSVLLIGKERMIYQIDVTNASAPRYNALGGMYAYRAVHSVGDSLFYPSERGIEALRQRDGVSYGDGIDQKTLSDNVKQIFELIVPQRRNLSCGIFIPKHGNYYFTMDSNNDGVPDRTLVYSALQGVKSWSEYDLPATYQYGEYEDEDGELHYVIASADGGQMLEIETGIQDNGIDIEFDLITKAWDEGKPEIEKDYDHVYLVGRKNEGGTIKAEIYIDGELVATEVITDDDMTPATITNPINTTPINTVPVGGGGETTVDSLGAFKKGIPIFSRGTTIQVRLCKDTTPTRMSLERITYTYEENEIALFPII